MWTLEAPPQGRGWGAKHSTFFGMAGFMEFMFAPWVLVCRGTVQGQCSDSMTSVWGYWLESRTWTKNQIVASSVSREIMKWKLPAKVVYQRRQQKQRVKDWFPQNVVPAFTWAATKILLLEYLRSKRAQKAERRSSSLRCAAAPRKCWLMKQIRTCLTCPRSK